MKERIWFKSFTLQDTIEVEEEVDSIIWGKYKTKNIVRAYRNRSYLYKGVADFINQIGSANFIGVTGSPFGENQDGYMYGEVVVLTLGSVNAIVAELADAAVSKTAPVMGYRCNSYLSHSNKLLGTRVG